MKILKKKQEQVNFAETKASKSNYDWDAIFCGEQVLLEAGTEAEVNAGTKDFFGKVENLAFNAKLMGKKKGFNVKTAILDNGNLVIQSFPATEEEKAAWAKKFAEDREKLKAKKAAEKAGTTETETSDIEPPQA